MGVFAFERQRDGRFIGSQIKQMELIFLHGCNLLSCSQIKQMEQSHAGGEKRGQQLKTIKDNYGGSQIKQMKLMAMRSENKKRRIKLIKLMAMRGGEKRADFHQFFIHPSSGNYPSIIHPLSIHYRDCTLKNQLLLAKNTLIRLKS